MQIDPPPCGYAFAWLVAACSREQARVRLVCGFAVRTARAFDEPARPVAQAVRASGRITSWMGFRHRAAWEGGEVSPARSESGILGLNEKVLAWTAARRLL
jgi:hypothetical protein